ncbi:peptidase S66 [Paenibacillus sp. J31TS4]|uniref:S66 peptidase family protein n=1 Tax=Paenibacillus sp. J31TS4 TaxID=2807195 RepID=UPI001B03E867|nr:LD-carboxypeptidase [Paenibacillus sp. J31TS4]GIP37147.1 peptidase S66 [Paenibacillus sp. J31TS4]
MANLPVLLNRGDTIGIVTLGSPLSADVIDSRLRLLQGMGFSVKLGRYVYAQNGFLAGTDQERASDLMAMFLDPQVKLILPTRGGVGVAGILPYLDYASIAAHPKLLSGYSDITVLLNVLAQTAGLITLQSLLLLDFRSDTPSYNYDQFFAATSVLSATRQIRNPADMPLVGRVPGRVTAPLVGGNLTSFVDTLGTPYEIDTKGKILLLEDTHEPVNTIFRYLNHLKLAGKLADCAGIVMGQCTACEDAYGVSYSRLIDEFLVPLGKPLLVNLASAHGLYKAAIPIGALVELDATNAALTVMQPTIRLS